MEYYATIKTNEDDILMHPHLVIWKYHQDTFHRKQNQQNVQNVFYL